MERATRETWVKRVERFAESGLTAREYANELGISESALKWWKWKLTSPVAKPRETGAKPTLSTRKRRLRKKSTRQLTFVEVKTTASNEPPIATAIEIVHRSGMQLRVGVGFDSPTLARVLDLMDSRP